MAIAEALISIDTRGFIFGSSISFQISKPMIFARKQEKPPGDLIKKYTLKLWRKFIINKKREH